MLALATILSALIGAVVGYFIGAYVGCDWLMPESNLCGLVGVFVTGPIGLALGAFVPWVIADRPKDESMSSVSRAGWVAVWIVIGAILGFFASFLVSVTAGPTVGFWAHPIVWMPAGAILGLAFALRTGRSANRATMRSTSGVN